MFSLALDLMAVLLMSPWSHTCGIWYGDGTKTHTLGMKGLRVNVQEHGDNADLDLVPNKFNVYRIPNEVTSYSHKKCANKQDNSGSRDLVA
jgi:hypothetical protein